MKGGWLVKLILLIFTVVVIVAVGWLYLGSILRAVLSWLGHNETQATAFRDLVAGLGVLVGGIFALYKFVLEGALTRRLQLEVMATVFFSQDKVFLHVDLKVENTGKRRVWLDQQLTKLGISFPLEEGGWTEPTNTQVLNDDELIEATEVVGDQRWIEISNAQAVAVQLEFYVIGQTRFSRQKNPGWMRREIVSLAGQN